MTEIYVLSIHVTDYDVTDYAMFSSFEQADSHRKCFYSNYTEYFPNFRTYKDPDTGYTLSINMYTLDSGEFI